MLNLTKFVVETENEILSRESHHSQSFFSIQFWIRQINWIEKNMVEQELPS